MSTIANFLGWLAANLWRRREDTKLDLIIERLDAMTSAQTANTDALNAALGGIDSIIHDFGTFVAGLEKSVGDLDAARAAGEQQGIDEATLAIQNHVVSGRATYDNLVAALNPPPAPAAPSGGTTDLPPADSGSGDVPADPAPVDAPVPGSDPVEVDPQGAAPLDSARKTSRK